MSEKAQIEILKLAQERWPDCKDPTIIPYLWDELIIDIREDTEDIKYSIERISFERVGPELMGYGPRSNILIVGYRLVRNRLSPGDIERN